MKRLNFSMIKMLSLVALVGGLSACSSTSDSKKIAQPKNHLIFFNESRLDSSRQQIAKNNPTFVSAYKDLIKLADKELKKKIDPVTNKTMMPDSGDIHDYHTLGSYYWPDPSKPNGLPWIYKDGEFNPINKGPATDFDRLKNMLESLHTLNLAYYLSKDDKYLTKAKDIVKTWFVDPKTKMNPNLNYGKAVPGGVSGSNFAVIDMTRIGDVLTTLQLLDDSSLWTEQDKTTMNKWVNDYYIWLTTSEFGKREATRSNNHGTNYDYQAISLMIYLGKIKEAEAIIEAAKKTRIASQIKPDGSQPLELARTKSVNYSVNNLWALARIADVSRRNTSVDLWFYESKDGVNLKTGFDFLIPYITQQKTWQWKQIIGGGAKAQLKNMALPMVSRTELMLGVKILPDGLNGYHKFSAKDILVYAPIDMNIAKK